MKIGIYGGSFNPIHFGHTGLATWVLENTDLDEVWLMVSPNNPLKDKSILADEQERLEKAREAIGDGQLAIGGVGKKLGFIAQEMGREINTLGSKSNQSEMQIIVVKMKDILEQIKEQVLNVL